MYIAGDNDVGGETEVVSPMLQDGFDRSFPNYLRGAQGNVFEFSMVGDAHYFSLSTHFRSICLTTVKFIKCLMAKG